MQDRIEVSGQIDFLNVIVDAFEIGFIMRERAIKALNTLVLSDGEQLARHLKSIININIQEEIQR